MWEETGAPHPEMDTNARGIVAKGVDDSQCVGSNYKNRRREGLTGQHNRPNTKNNLMGGLTWQSLPNLNLFYRVTIAVVLRIPRLDRLSHNKGTKRETLT